MELFSVGYTNSELRTEVWVGDRFGNHQHTKWLKLCKWLTDKVTVSCEKKVGCDRENPRGEGTKGTCEENKQRDREAGVLKC